MAHWPGQDARGPDELADLIAQTKSMFSELIFEIEIEPLSDADMVAGRWIGSGRTTDGTAAQFVGTIFCVPKMVASANTGSHLPKVKDLDIDHPHQCEVAAAIAHKSLSG